MFRCAVKTTAKIKQHIMDVTARRVVRTFLSVWLLLSVGNARLK